MYTVEQESIYFLYVFIHCWTRIYISCIEEHTLPNKILNTYIFSPTAEQESIYLIYIFHRLFHRTRIYISFVHLHPLLNNHLQYIPYIHTANHESIYFIYSFHTKDTALLQGIHSLYVWSSLCDFVVFWRHKKGYSVVSISRPCTRFYLPFPSLSVMLSCSAPAKPVFSPNGIFGAFSKHVLIFSCYFLFWKFARIYLSVDGAQREAAWRQQSGKDKTASELRIGLRNALCISMWFVNCLRIILMDYSLHIWHDLRKFTFLTQRRFKRRSEVNKQFAFVSLSLLALFLCL